MAVLKAELLYKDQVYDMQYNGEYYFVDLTASGEAIKTDVKYTYLAVAIMITDDAGNVTVKTISDAEFRDGLLIVVRNKDIFPISPIIALPSGHEIGYISKAKKIDIDVGTDNNFSILMDADEWSADEYDYNHQIFVPYTEYGGIIERKKTFTNDNSIEWLGHTWRGLLDRDVIEPPEGQEHYIAKGEANSAIKNIMEGRFGDFFRVENYDSGIIVSCDIDRYSTVLDGLTKMLKKEGARLNLCYKQGGPNESGAVWLSAVKIQDWSEKLEYSQDCNVDFSTDDDRMGINHLICGGKGEGTAREIVHLYVQKNGTIGKEKHYKGLSERVAFYDYSSAEGDELIKNGEKRLRELMNNTKMQIYIDNADVELQDIVGGRDRITGLYAKLPIVGKTLVIQNGESEIKYKVEEVT